MAQVGQAIYYAFQVLIGAVEVEGFAAFVVQVARIAILSAAGKALAPDENLTQTALTKLTTFRSTIEPQKFMYGEDLVSGPVVFHNLSGSENRSIHMLVALLGHTASGMGDVWLDGDVIDSADINDNITSPGTGNGEVTGGKFRGDLSFSSPSFIQRRLGNEVFPDPILNGAFPTNWTSSHLLTGIAALSVRLDLFTGQEDVFFNGAPRNYRALVRGFACYDPRLDDTNGGTGPHRLNDEGTWEWTQNPALAWAHFRMNTKFGYGEDSALIDWPSVAAAADRCDELVTVPDGAGGSTTQPRYTINATFSAAESRDSINTQLEACMQGWSVFSQGLFLLWAGGPQTPTVTLDETHLAGKVTIQASATHKDRWNAVRGNYIDPTRAYRANPYIEQRSSTFLAEDGGGEYRYKEVDYPLTQNEYECQRKAIVDLTRSRRQQIISWEGNWACLPIQPGRVVGVTLDSLPDLAGTFLCTEWKLREGGGVTLTLAEWDNADWTDPALLDYSERTASGVITFNDLDDLKDDDSQLAADPYFGLPIDSAWIDEGVSTGGAPGVTRIVQGASEQGTNYLQQEPTINAQGFSRAVNFREFEVSIGEEITFSMRLRAGNSLPTTAAVGLQLRSTESGQTFDAGINLAPRMFRAGVDTWFGVDEVLVVPNFGTLTADDRILARVYVETGNSSAVQSLADFNYITVSRSRAARFKVSTEEDAAGATVLDTEILPGKPERHGADPLGVQDSTAALLDLFTIAFTAGYGEVDLGNGTYLISGPITPQVSTAWERIKVKGNGARIIVDPAATFFGYVMFVGSTTNMDIEIESGVTIDCNNRCANGVYVDVRDAVPSTLTAGGRCVINATVLNCFKDSTVTASATGITVIGAFEHIKINGTVRGVDRVNHASFGNECQGISVSDLVGLCEVGAMVSGVTNPSVSDPDADGISIFGRGGATTLREGTAMLTGSRIENCRGRHVKIQCSDVDLHDFTIAQDSIDMIAQSVSIDLQFGNGKVHDITFEYRENGSGASPLGSSHSVIASQQILTDSEQVCKLHDCTVFSEVQIPRIVSLNYAGSPAAKLVVHDFDVVSLEDMAPTNEIVTRAFVEFDDDDLVSQDGLSIVLHRNSFPAVAGARLIGYTGHNGTDDLDDVLSIEAVDNRNTGNADCRVFHTLSGSIIAQIEQLKVRGNVNMQAFYANLNTDLDNLPEGTDFTIDLATATLANAPSRLPSTGTARIQTGSASSGTTWHPATITLESDARMWTRVSGSWRASLEDYQSGAGAPSGSATPEYVGQYYLDTTGNAWYKAYGTANTNWQAH